MNFTKSSVQAIPLARHQYLTYDFSFGSVVITTIAIRTSSTTILMLYTFYNTMKQKILSKMKQKHNSHLPTLSCVHSPTVRKLQHLRATSASTHQRGSCLYEMSYYISATARDPSLYVVFEQSLTYKIKGNHSYYCSTYSWNETTKVNISKITRFMLKGLL